MSSFQKTLFYIYLPLIALVLYAFNPFELYFLNDDFVHIPLSAEKEFFQHKSFRPVSELSIMFDYWLWNKNAWGYHLTNLLIHIADTFLVYFLARSINKRFALATNAHFAFFVALLFFTYSMHSEAIFWILGRSASLGLLFFIPSVIFYFKRQQVSFFVFSLICSFIAWMTYESTWILPVVFLLISGIESGRSFQMYKREMKYLIAVFTAFLLYLLGRFLITGQVGGDYEMNGFFPINITFLLSSYFKLMIRSWLPYAENSTLLVALFALVILVLVVVFFKVREVKFRKSFVVLLFCWLISLIPYISLSIDTKGTESERFLYLPSLFISLIVALIISKVNKFALRQFLLLILVLIQIGFLFNNKKNYKFAGEVTQTTFLAINNMQHKRYLFIDSLPQEYKGALIFRTGFFDGLKWMKNNNTVDSVFVLSQQQNDQHFVRNYKIQQIDPPSITADSIFVNKRGGITYQKARTKTLVFDPLSDVYFKFGNGALLSSEAEPVQSAR